MALLHRPHSHRNLGDITRRAVEVLSGVDFIISRGQPLFAEAAEPPGDQEKGSSATTVPRGNAGGEDRRHAGRGRRRPDHRLGHPRISDPGFILVRRAIDAGIAVVPLPGATAFVPALAASGLDPRRFLFLGFPPGGRRAAAFPAGAGPAALHAGLLRVATAAGAPAGAAAAALGDREFAWAKEVSKRHEKFIRSSLGQWRAALEQEPVLGEMVLVIAGEPGSPLQRGGAAARGHGRSLRFLPATLRPGQECPEESADEKKGEGRPGAMTRRRVPAAAALLLALAAPLRTGASEQAVVPPRSGFVIAPVVYYTPETRLAWDWSASIISASAMTPGPPALPLRFNLIRTQNKQSVAQVDYELYLGGGRFLIDGMAKYSYYPTAFTASATAQRRRNGKDFTSSSWRLQLNLQRRFGDNLFTGLHLETYDVSMRAQESGGQLAGGAIAGSEGGPLTVWGFSPSGTAATIRSRRRAGCTAPYFVNRFSAPAAATSHSARSPSTPAATSAWARTRSSPCRDCCARCRGSPVSHAPEIRGLNLLRGYYDGRYCDRGLLALQTEYRRPLWGRFGACVFAGMAQVQPRFSLLELSGFHLAGGAGLRYKFNRRENLNVRLDVGFAGDSPAFYLTFAEAFRKKRTIVTRHVGSAMIKHPQDAGCKPDPVAKNHLSGQGIAAKVQRLTQGIGRESLERPLFSLAPDGVCLSPGVAARGR